MYLRTKESLLKRYDMALGQLWVVLRARWLLASCVFVATLVVVAVVTLIMPWRYTATASLLINVKDADPIAGMVIDGGAAPSYVATQVDVIASTRVSSRVVRNMRAEETSRLRARWLSLTDGDGDFDIWLNETVRNGLDVRPLRGSNVINVSFIAEDPDFATSMADAYVQAYLETSLELGLIQRSCITSFSNK